MPAFAEPELPCFVDRQNTDLEWATTLRDIELTTHAHPPEGERLTLVAVAVAATTLRRLLLAKSRRRHPLVRGSLLQL